MTDDDFDKPMIAVSPRSSTPRRRRWHRHGARRDALQPAQPPDAEDNKPDGWKPGPRDRKVSAALWAYAAMATSADKGAVRDVSQIQG